MIAAPETPIADTAGMDKRRQLQQTVETLRRQTSAGSYARASRKGQQLRRLNEQMAREAARRYRREPFEPPF